MAIVAKVASMTKSPTVDEINMLNCLNSKCNDKN